MFIIETRDFGRIWDKWGTATVHTDMVRIYY